MIEIYTAPSCRSCTKAINWLQSHHIPYMEHNIYDSLSQKNELEKILLNTPEGFDSIISMYSDAYQALKIDFNDLKMSEAIALIKKHPSIIKKPIIIDSDHNNIEVGYNKDTIEIFGLAATHDFNTCEFSAEECRKKTRIKMFRKVWNYKENKVNDK